MKETEREREGEGHKEAGRQQEGRNGGRGGGKQNDKKCPDGLRLEPVAHGSCPSGLVHGRGTLRDARAGAAVHRLERGSIAPAAALAK